jgi:alpha-beta hydrolase superfamily lysophospholipase
VGVLFQDDFLDGFGTWPLAYIPYGGPDYGELAAVATAVGGGDDAAYYAAWIAAGDRMVAAAESANEAGHKQSARELYLRASAFYAASYHPIYGAPVDPRLAAAFKNQRRAFDCGLALNDPQVLPQTVPFEGRAMPAYFLPAAGYGGVKRPTIIFTNGYDGTITDMYFALAVAASRRGYHSLLFDGPGQGAMLYEMNIPLRPDWETVVGAVVDFALTLPEVHPEKLIISGWSLGGYLAPRAASGEHRLAACIADPGQWSLADSFRALAGKIGIPASAVADLSALDETDIQKVQNAIDRNRELRWKIVQRGFWANGKAGLRDYFAEAERYTMKSRAEAIRCPTLLTAAENDPLAEGAQTLFEALKCQKKKLIKFSAAEGAGDHCEMMNRSLVNRVALDWLDEVVP